MEANAEERAPLQPGIVLHDRFLIIKQDGSATASNRYLAYEKRLGHKPCTIWEWIPGPMSGQQREHTALVFRHEVELLVSLRHPSLPSIYDSFEEKGRYYLATKYVSGTDLDAERRKRGGTVAELPVTRWAMQICDTLAYIHGHEPSILYRNLSPVSLVLDERQGTIVLIDFGIMRIVDAELAGAIALGPIGYAAPELFAGRPEPRSDVYALGATVFNLLTGVDPRANPLLVFDFSKSRRPSQINPAITPEMEGIIAKTVAYEPGDRFETALELKRALEEHERQLVLASRSRSGRLSMPASAPLITCPRCGAENKATAVVCRMCASLLAGAPPAQPRDPQDERPFTFGGDGHRHGPSAAEVPTQRYAEAPGGTIVCPACASDNIGGWAFCHHCGLRLTAAAAPQLLQPLPQQFIPTEPSPSPVPDVAPPSPPEMGIPPQSTMAMSSVPATAAPQAGKLVLLTEDGAVGETYTLRSEETRIGRSHGDIRFPTDGYMSGRHARIARRNGRFVLIDDNSRNGMYLKISDEVELHPGDTMIVGRQIFRFAIDEADEGSSAPRGAALQQPLHSQKV